MTLFMKQKAEKNTKPKLQSWIKSKSVNRDKISTALNQTGDETKETQAYLNQES